MWGRMRHALVRGEEPTGLQRILVLADSGNGVSSVLPGTDWAFINPELTVHLAAEPQGEWLCLDAQTSLDARGFGLAASRLYRPRRPGRARRPIAVRRSPLTRSHLAPKAWMPYRAESALVRGKEQGQADPSTDPK